MIKHIYTTVLILLVPVLTYANDWNLTGFEGKSVYSIAVNR